VGEWVNFGLIDPQTSNTVNLILYHDLVLVVIVSVIVLVGYFLLSLLLQKLFLKGRWDFTIKENQSLEIAWTIGPSFVLFGLGCVSLYNLYIIEVGSGVSHSVEAHGNQWFWVYTYTVDIENVSDRYVKDLEAACADHHQWEGFAEYIRGLYTGFLRLGIRGFWRRSRESYEVPGDMLKQGVSLNTGISSCDVTLPCILAFGVKNEVKVSTRDVIHRWGVPGFGVKADAVPGHINCVAIEPLAPGFAHGFCYELCGVGHRNMPIACLVTSPVNVGNLLSTQVLRSGDIWGMPQMEKVLRFLPNLQGSRDFRVRRLQLQKRLNLQELDRLLGD